MGRRQKSTQNRAVVNQNVQQSVQQGIHQGIHQGLRQDWWRWFNLRPEEGERTFLMFAFYTLSSIGILWLEVSVAALFLGEYGAESLPWIYIASAGIGTGLGIFYSWLQKILPLHRVIVLTAVLMAVPLVLFWVGLQPALLGGYTVFLMRLWLEAIYVISELNTSITANQLFTIREIKRTYPLISSGILAADVWSGLSLPLLRGWIGLPNVILLAALMLFCGAGILLYLTRAYRSFFPDFIRRRPPDQAPPPKGRRLQKLQQQYVILVFAFFVLVQVLALLLDFQYLSQLERGMTIDKIADFLALFSAILGVFELATQWFVSGRAIERLGMFKVAAILPMLLVSLSVLSLAGLLSLFVGVIVLKFVDELLRYTLIASTGPVMFQPIPEANRNRVQSVVRGIAEPLATGLTGATLLGTLGLFQYFSALAQNGQRTQSLVFLGYTALLSLIWLLTVLGLRSKYTEVLMLSTDRGQLSLSHVDLVALKRNLVDTFSRAETDEVRSACLELLREIDPKHAAEAIAPLLPTLSPQLQQQSLVLMLHYPNPIHLDSVRALIDQSVPPEVLALALRYIWLTELEPDMQQLKSYLKPDVAPIVRGVAAALLLRRGEVRQKAEAIDSLRRMLTHKQEQERVMGCRALGDAVYLQSLRLHIRSLLQDRSLLVRCAMLEAIAATQLEEYYPCLLRGLHYKSTRESAQRALVRLGDEGLPLLVNLAENPEQPEGIRMRAWMSIGQIGTTQAIDLLVSRLDTTWGTTRRLLLRVLLRIPQEAGVEAVAEQLGRRGIEVLIIQELRLLGYLYASLVDLLPSSLASEEADLLHRALRDAETDGVDRLFLLMRFLYDSSKIQAAAFSLRSGSRDSMARGLEILDHTIDLSSKAILLNLLDRRSPSEKLQTVSHLIHYRPMQPVQRLRDLLQLRHLLSDWALACCFHLARYQRWELDTEQVLAGLRHPTGFVREATLSYLNIVAPRTLRGVLPRFKNDPDRIVTLQVRQMMAELGRRGVEG